MQLTRTEHALWNRSFILCVLNNLFLFIYYFAMLTVLPLYIMQDLGGTVKEAGLALTLFLLSSIGIRPFSGLIIQRLGKRLALRGAGILFVLFAFSFVWVDSMWSLLLLRFLHGFWFSILTTVNVPVVNDFIPEQRKGEGMGYFVMSTNLGVVFGPVVALTMIQMSSYSHLFLLLAVVSGVGFIFTFMLNVQDEATERVTQQTEPAKLNLHDIIETKVLAIGGVALLTALAYSSITSFITAFAESQNLLPYASVFFIVFAVSMIVVRPWVGRRYDRQGPSSVIYPSFVFFAVGLILVSFVDGVWLLWCSAVFIGIGYGSLFPCMQTIAIQSVSKQRMGHGISTFFTLFDLGLALGSVCMGLLIAWFGFQKTYWLCAVLVMLTLWIYRTTVAQQLQAQKDTSISSK